LLTIADYYRERYGKYVEVVCTVIIMISYLGWVSAQVSALGLVFNVLSDGAIGMPLGMCIGVVSILAYTLFGGMWSVAITDFIQMIILVVGLSVLAVFSSDMAGGADKVLALAASRDMFHFLPPPNWHDILFFIASGVTIMFGSIPQQDVFQRVMSANSVRSATLGPVIGWVCYLLFGCVPMFFVVSALNIMPETAEQLIKEDPQRILPSCVMQKMPFVMQVIFFGALLSAIKSTASATLLAPSVTFTENIWRQFHPHMSDRQELKAMRVTVLLFSILVLLYAISMQGTSIYEMVSGAYQVPLVGAFVPLLFGLYWPRANTQGAVLSMGLGLLTWLVLLATPFGEEFPAQLGGLLAAFLGMILGSLGPQIISNSRSAHRPHIGLDA